jgi:hypothetical protein
MLGVVESVSLRSCHVPEQALDGREVIRVYPTENAMSGRVCSK